MSKRRTLFEELEECVGDDLSVVKVMEGAWAVKDDTSLTPTLIASANRDMRKGGAFIALNPKIVSPHEGHRLTVTGEIEGGDFEEVGVKCETCGEVLFSCRRG